ncbi:glycosyltransferase family 4 protein [Flavisolibacter sp. BT320]|nr:glycosyltransferase family 4 protein [Flavisolibacter longurius]
MSDKHTLTILHIIAVNGIGGAEKLLVTLLPALLEKGTQATCLLFYTSPYLPDAKSIGAALAQKGIPIIYREYSGIFQQANLSFIAATIQSQSPDVVHVHLKHAEIWIALLKVFGKVKQPVVATLHGYRDQYHSVHGLQWNSRGKFSPYYWLSRFAASRIDRFISISNGVARFFMASGMVAKEKMKTIYHGTTVDDIHLVPRQQADPDFVVIGRLVGFKGHRYALEAMTILAKKYPQAQLHFYGVGPEEESLRQMTTALGLEANVIFHGFVENLKEKLPDHSIALMPSIGEPFGLVFFDAFKAGLPVVAFDLPAGNEIIQDKENGLLANPLDAASLAARVEELLQDAELFQSTRQKAIAVLKDHFTIGQMAERYIDFYRETVEVTGKK